MKKSVFTATKLTEGKVDFISLVPKGANRVPFKVLKQEKDMKEAIGLRAMDLTRLFSTKKAENPNIVGVIVVDDNKLDSVKKQLKDIGFDVDNELKEDGKVLFKQPGFDQNADLVIKANDEIALVVKSFMPYSMDISSNGTSFSEMCNAQGFYPGVRGVMDTLTQSVTSIVSASDDLTEASSNVKKMMDEATSYVVSMVSSLPSKAFKAELVEGEVPAEAPPPETPPAPAVTEAPSAEPSVAPTPPATTPEALQVAQPTTMESISQAIEKAMSAVQAKFEEQFAKTVTVVADLGENVAALAQKLEKTDEIVSKTESTVKNTLIGGVTLGDSSGVQKSSSEGEYANIDTARNRRR